MLAAQHSHVELAAAPCSMASPVLSVFLDFSSFLAANTEPCQAAKSSEGRMKHSQLLELLFPRGCSRDG